jgi:hypothetical protein
LTGTCLGYIFQHQDIAIVFTRDQEGRGMHDKVRENRLRRMAERQGLRLEKSRLRDPRALGYGGYMLIGVKSNLVMYGDQPYPYGCTLDDIAWYLAPEDRLILAR